MKVSLIGAGNVATILAKKIFASNHIVQYVYARNIDNAIGLANQVNAKPINNLKLITDDNDIVIVATSDKAIEEVVKSYNFKKTILIHTAGSVSKNLLQKYSVNFGVIYPIQSLRKNMDSTIEVPFLVDSNNLDSLQIIKDLAYSISSKVLIANDEVRLKVHVAAVFACNFVNYMYLQSSNICERNGIDFSILYPLIIETASRLKNNYPKDVFTGPAVRKDFETIQKHLSVLSDNKNTLELYNYITNLILAE